MSNALTSILLICAATTFAAAIVIAQRRFVAGVARRFVALPRVEQVLLVLMVGVMTVCAQKSGIEKVEVEGGSRKVEVKGGGGEWMVDSSVVPVALNAEEEETQRRGEEADSNNVEAESLRFEIEDEASSSEAAGRRFHINLDGSLAASATSNSLSASSRLSNLRVEKTTTNDVARGYALVEARTNATVSYAMPTNGALVGTWHKTGAYEDVVRVCLSNAEIQEAQRRGAGAEAPSNVEAASRRFVLPINNNCVTSLWAYTWGKVRTRLRDKAHEIVAVGAPMSCVAGEGRLWTATTTNGSWLITWEDFRVGREILNAEEETVEVECGSQKVEVKGGGGERMENSFSVPAAFNAEETDAGDEESLSNHSSPSPLTSTFPPISASPSLSNLRVENADSISAQIEFFPNCDFIARSNDVERVYRRVNPDDWDDDGIANEEDDAPLVADTPQFGPQQTLPDGANESAYYWVDLVVPRANAKVTFTGDGASNLADPTFIAKADETNRVTLLIGKSYVATCAFPLEVVAKSSASIDVSRPDDCRAEICWPVEISLADGAGASFGMTVRPSKLAGTFFWTNFCCGVSKKSDSFSFLCTSNNCRCTGCSTTGFFRYEGYRIACVGGTCGCLPSGGPPPEAEPASVSVAFSKAAIIFEDAYDNSPTNHVGWRSTETVLSCSASGGAKGGFLYVSLEDSDRLVRYGGQSLPHSKALAANETVSVACRYRAVKASDAADDIRVTATFVESETGATKSAVATATAIRLRFTPEVEAPKNTSIGRHRYGVCEIVNCFQYPPAPKVAWRTTGCVAAGNARFRLPLTAAENPICASCRGETYIPALSVIEPSEVEGRAEDVVLYGVPTNHAGGIGMQLGIYVLPGEVSFSGLMLEEIPCDRGSHGGYFDNAIFSGIWTHSSDNGAGRWWNVSMIDNRMGGESVVDTVAIMSELPRINHDGEYTDDLQGSWSDGYIEWEIPFGWNAVDGEQVPCREFATDTRHRLEIDASGTVLIRKLANEVVREISGKVLLNGERKDQ